MMRTQVAAETSPEEAVDFRPGEESGLHFIRDLVGLLRGLPVVVAWAILVALIVFIGWADRASSAEVSLFLFYAVPIALSVSALGVRAGVATTALSGLVWWLANRTSNLYQTEAGYILAMVNRLFYFGVVVVAVTAARKKQQSDAARIRALEERRKLEHDLVRVSEHEQQRIGQDLHDGLCQRLAAIGCAARMLSDDLRVRDSEGAQDAAMIEGALQEAVLEARNLARGVSPLHVDSDSLRAALGDLALSTSRLTGINILVKDSAEEVGFEPTVAMHLYRIAQEAVANAVRHSGASQIVVGLQMLSERELELRIEDDGRGLDDQGQISGNGMGLSTMRYRAEMVGGRLEVLPGPQGGTVVCCRCILPEKEPELEMARGRTNENED